MQPLSLSGTSNLPNGSAVTVTLNNVNYQTTVENGRWSVQVPVSDVLDLANTLYTVSVSGTDSVGNRLRRGESAGRHRAAAGDRQHLCRG